jgi:hypothetical protein
MEVSIQANAAKTKYMFISRQQTKGKNCYIQVADKSVENLAELKHLEIKLTNQNCIHEEIKSRRNFGLLATCSLGSSVFLFAT